MSGKRKMRVLVIGRDGQIGNELTRVAPPTDLSVTALGRDALDITQPDAVARAVEAAQAGFVVNAAAYTHVDRAETERGQAFAVNRDGAAHVAAACRAHGVPLLHLSTDYVFDGTKSGAYAESDPVRPLGVYGKSKEAGERAVRNRLDRHLVLRTAWVFSPFRHNFVKTMLRLGGEREEIGIVDDQTGCPTAAADIARTILAMAERAGADGFDCWGTYHFCNSGPTTWYGFAREIFSAAAARGAPTPRLRAIGTSDYRTAARRPANSVLDCGRMAATFGVTPRQWRPALDECLDELLGPEGKAGGE